MPRNLKRGESIRIAKGKRDTALKREELRGPSEPRVSAAGPTSMAVKLEDPETRRIIDEALAKRRSSDGT